jgi:hypothetical protein
LNIDVMSGVAVAGRRAPSVVRITNVSRLVVHAAPKKAIEESAITLESVFGEDHPRRREVKSMSGERRSPP